MSNTKKNPFHTDKTAHYKNIAKFHLIFILYIVLFKHQTNKKKSFNNTSNNADHPCYILPLDIDEKILDSN